MTNKNKENKKSKKEVKNKKHFLKDFKAELKKVVWPTPKQLVNSTIAVITIVLAIGIIVFLLDLGFEFINAKNIKMQEKLQEKYSTTTTNTSEENTSTTSENTDEASSEESNINTSTAE